MDINMTEATLRYSRQIILDGFGVEKQEKLIASKVLVVGAGGLGSPALLYLAAAGVGTIGIVDFDTVTVSNLNRQVIHYTDDIGSKKTDSAEGKIKRLNPNVNVKKYAVRLNINNIEEIIAEYDIIIDATDNIPARYLISDACYFIDKPLIEGAAVGFEGILLTIIPGITPCYRCLYPKPPEDGVLHNCSDTGILGMVTGMIGTMQALEAIKVILGMGETLSGRILAFDALTSSFNEISLPTREDCPLCGKDKRITELVEYEVKCKVKF